MSSITAPIKVSESFNKEGFANAESFNPSPQLEISAHNDEIEADDDQSSISTSSIISDQDDLSDAFTFSTKMTAPHETKDEINPRHATSETIESEINSSMEVMNLSEDSDEDEFIEDFFAPINSDDIDNLKTEKYSYDQESKQVRGRPSACVFVASLSSNLGDDVLCQSVTDHFKQWGEMKLVKVLRDPANRPYAFVQYANDSDAELAISEAQHSILNGRTIRCEKARVNRTLYFELSNTGICEKTLKKLMVRFGEVEKLVKVDDNFTSNAVNSDQKAKHKRWFCKFVYRQDAISAFANLKTKIDWNVEWTQNIEDEYSEVPEVTIDKHSIFVGHLDPRISKDELVERFESHGKIKEAILVNRPLSNFAFIKFLTKEAAAAAVERENHSMFKYKTIHVQYREMYNNYRRNSSEDRKYKLSLAPPPVNFNKRHSFNSNNKKRNGLEYNRKYSPFFAGANLSKEPRSRSYSDAFKARNIKATDDDEPIQISRFEGRRRKYHKFVTFKPQFSYPHHAESSTAYTDNGLESNHEVAIMSDQLDQKASAGNTNSSANENDTDNDESFMTTAGKTGYTHSSIDNGEHEVPVHVSTNPASFQYPMYYYYPTKDGNPYLTHPGQHVPNPEFRGHYQNGPPPSNSGYYYPYHNYGTPTSPNGQMPVYPMYVYHPVSMLHPEGPYLPGNSYEPDHLKHDD
ncbi:hypothetical protein CANINC_004442 [Pichia inconspicua]|uniref:RRM domain-containing protein n=1 Tax=Pichia inconspicua TaxID=52247 RepID=A0A4T0WV97_9ASCO|nr:hypothetical protein CANINC_004442 [[Candida] inconspicua]